MKLNKKLLSRAALLAMLTAAPALADDKPATFELSIKNHVFTPAEIKVPADKPFIIYVKNLDSEAEEFDSDDLSAEKVITGNGEGIVSVSALKAGRYEFEGEYHSDSAHGVVIAQ